MTADPPVAPAVNGALDGHPDKRPAVAVVRLDLLPISETFIRAQAKALERWRPIMVGARHVPGGLPLDDLPTLMFKPRASLAGRAAHEACRRLGLPYPPALAKLRSLAPALVHVHFGTDAVDFWPYAKRLKVPTLVTLHGYDATIHPAWWQSGAGGSRRRSYPRQFAALAAQEPVHFIAVSDFIRRHALALGVPDRKIHTLPIGIDTDAFPVGGITIERRKPRVLYVGRLVAKKGVAYLIQACAKAREQLPDLELAVVGAGPLLPELQSLAATLGLNVEFLGGLDPARVLEQMQKARVFCLPSVVAENGDAEGFGMVLLEAQSTGLPVITSALGADHPGLINGETGFVTRERDVPELSARILQFLTDDGFAMAAAATAARFVRERFELRDCTRRLEALYDDLTHRRARK